MKNLDDSVKLDVVVVALASELYEVLAGSRSVVVVHLDGEGAHRSLQSYLRRAAVGCRHRLSPRKSIPLRLTSVRVSECVTNGSGTGILYTLNFR